MRVLAITETCDLGSLYQRLIGGGHQVKVSISEPLANGTMAGLVPQVADWRSELPWIREAGAEGIIMFEAVGFGELQDELRGQGFNVVGGSAFGDCLERDRAYAFEILAKNGLKLAPVVEFARADEAIDDLSARPRRCVFKLCESEGETFVGTFPDGSDIAAMLKVHPPKSGQPFILMDHVDGVETGVGAFFNGERFLRPACIDWEHKHLFAGNMGELTGEMGTVASFTGSDRLFELALEPLEPLFREAGHVGWVNLNTIINKDGVWPLEFTCRFGYPGFAVLEPLQTPDWAEMLRSMTTSECCTFEACPGYSVAIVLTTPPMPHSRKQVKAPVGLPLLTGDIEPRHLHLGEVGMRDGTLVTSGLYGWTAVVTGVGPTIIDARGEAYANARKVSTPNLRYRLDIGDSLINEDFERLLGWGWVN